MPVVQTAVCLFRKWTVIKPESSTGTNYSGNLRLFDLKKRFREKKSGQYSMDRALDVLSSFLTGRLRWTAGSAGRHHRLGFVRAVAVFSNIAPMLRHVRSVLNSARLISSSEPLCLHGLALSTSAVSQAPAPPDNGWLPPEAYFYERQLPSHEKYCRQRNRMHIGPRYPAIAQNAYIAPSAVVIGDVDILDSVRTPFDENTRLNSGNCLGGRCYVVRID
jgi:hypothetical protein